MYNLSTCIWYGASGNRYEYIVYQLPQAFNYGQVGNYIFAKIVNNLWIPVYIGEGDLGERISQAHHQIACIILNSATHVHAHLNSKEKSRLFEEKDLLNNYPLSYEPSGCNIKVGG